MWTCRLNRSLGRIRAEYQEDSKQNGIHASEPITSSNSSLLQNELKKTKIHDLINNIPNSINNNKENLEVASIKKLKERDNAKKLLTGKIISRITTGKDIPQYFFIDIVHTYLLIMKVDSSRWVFIMLILIQSVKNCNMEFSLAFLTLNSNTWVWDSWSTLRFRFSSR